MRYLVLMTPLPFTENKLKNVEKEDRIKNTPSIL